MECLFCKIAQDEAPSETVFGDEDVRIFKNIHPKAPIHLLVIPKIHIESIAHLEEGHSDIIAKLIYAAKHEASRLGLMGYKLAFNVGREGGQMIDHLHLHLLGGWDQNEPRSELI